MAPICQNIVLQLNYLLANLEMLSKLTIAANNTTSKFIGYTVARQMLTHKIWLDKEAFMSDLASTRAQSQFNHLYH